MKNHYNFGKNLGDVLQALDVSPASLSRMTGLAPSCINKILACQRNPSLRTIVKILQVLPIKFERLVTYERL